MREALAQARAELGPAALVLSTKMVPTPGWRGWMGARVVEVTAATDRPAPSEPAWAADVGTPDAVSVRPAKRARTPATAEAGRGALVARLAATGLERHVAEGIAASVPGTPRRGAEDVTLRQAVTDRVAAVAAGVEQSAPIEMFVGPPGVGKTTTIAKIAAQARAGRGERVLLASADGQRPGAIEQLRGYAGIIGAPFAAGRSPDDLGTLVADARHAMLIDTPGRSLAEGELTDSALQELGRRLDVRTHLVVAASTPPRVVERLLEMFRVVKPDRIVLTKVDEADSIAPLIGFLERRRLLISFLGTGQRIPDDLQVATPAVVAAHVLGTGRHAEPMS